MTLYNFSGNNENPVFKIILEKPVLRAQNVQIGFPGNKQDL